MLCEFNHCEFQVHRDMFFPVLDKITIPIPWYALGNSLTI